MYQDSERIFIIVVDYKYRIVCKQRLYYLTTSGLYYFPQAQAPLSGAGGGVITVMSTCFVHKKLFVK